jgi:hypothetical protein
MALPNDQLVALGDGEPDLLCLHDGGFGTASEIRYGGVDNRTFDGRMTPEKKNERLLAKYL